MHLADYLKRIRYQGALRPDLATLKALHEAHLRTIPYENLDIHLGREVKLDIQHIFSKLVHEKRGGWCFEMNGLFAWALKALGFKVTLLAGAVDRKNRGDSALFNHLLLLVKLEQLYIADVGFGDGLIHPIPLQEGKYQQDFRSFRLEKLAADYWRFYNHSEGSAQSFDFTQTPRHISDFSEQSHSLQSSPESGFVKVTVCQIVTKEGSASLRGAILKRLSTKGITEKTIMTQAAFDKELKETFSLSLAETPELWPKIWQKHQIWLKEQV